MSKRVVLGGLGFAVALVLAWFFLFWSPQSGKTSDAEEREAAAASQNSQLEVRLARLRSLEERAASLDAEGDELDAAVPPDARIAEFILDADEAAVRAGVDLVTLTPGEPAVGTSTPTTTTPPTTAPPAEGSAPPEEITSAAAPAAPTAVSDIAVTVQVKGTYFSVLDFVNRLEDLPRIVVIDGLQLTPSETTEGESELTASLTTRIFTSAAPDAPAGTDITPPADGSTTTTTTTTTGAAT